MPRPPTPYFRISGTDMGLIEGYPEAGALIPGHIAAYYANGLADHLRSDPRPYLLEPATWMFVRPPRYMMKANPKNGEDHVMLSYNALARVLGGPFAEVVGVSKLSINQLTQDALQEATQAWIVFQQEYTKSQEVNKIQTTLQRYEELAKGAKPGAKPAKPVEPPAPAKITALSFPIAKKEDPWFAKVVESAETTVAAVGRDKTLALLHVESWSEGDIELFDALASELPASIGVELWIDGHSDYENAQRMSDYIEVVKTLGKRHRTVVLAFSSLLGAFLAPIGVGAFVSGMGTSEEKSSTSEPATGGGYARYYVPLSSKPERIADCRLFFTEHPDQFCTGQACTSVLGRKPLSKTDFDSFFKEFFMPQSKSHFLEVRKRELDTISKQSPAQAAQALRDRAVLANTLNYDAYFQRLPRHLESWATIIESL